MRMSSRCNSFSYFLWGRRAFLLSNTIFPCAHRSCKALVNNKHQTVQDLQLQFIVAKCIAHSFVNIILGIGCKYTRVDGARFSSSTSTTMPPEVQIEGAAVVGVLALETAATG